MRRFSLKYIISATLIMCTAICLSAIPSRPESARLVNDLAGIFSDSQREALESTLVAFDDSTSNQIAVVTVNDLEGYDPAEYATRIGLDWGVGSAKFDNGIVMLIKPKTSESGGKVFIAIGYGLEGSIPDAYAKRIINEVMIPHFMQNDYYGGAASGCEILMKLASGEISELREQEEGIEPIIASIVFLIILLVIFAIIIKDSQNNGGSGNRGRRIYTGPVITSGHNYGGWSSGGSFGGFGGGFGGFGGGSFGGGGAGGSW